MVPARGSKLRLALVAAVGAAVGLAIGVVVTAQPQSATPGVTQEFLLRNAPLEQFPGKVVTVFTGNFEPGAETPFHRHPATELLFVIEGNGVMHIQGRESRELKEGGVVMVQPDAGQDSFIHQAVNSSATEKMKTLVVVIHNMGTLPAELVVNSR